MRTLTVIAEMGTGGAESVVTDLARHLDGAGHDVRVASSGGWRADALAATGIDTLMVPLRSGGPVPLGRSIVRLRQETLVRPVDLVHAHNVRASLTAHLATRVGRRPRPPLLTTVHGLADTDYRRAVRLLAVSDLVVAVSQDVADRLLAGGLESARLRVVENAVPSPRSAPATRAQVRRELALPDPCRVVLCVARLASPKRVDLLLDAWADVPGATLLLAGDGPDRAVLERRAAPLGDRVRFLGERHDVDRLLAAADLLVLPSDREGLPMAVLEALAAGVPVVASSVGGIAHLGAGTVELVEPGRADALGAAVSRLLGDPERRDELVRRGRAVVGRRFSSTRMRADYDVVYELLRKERDPS